MDTAIVTAFADNSVGRLMQDLIYQGGVDQSHVRWVKFDIKSLKAPLPQIELVPTGGVTLATADAYVEAGAAAIGVGADLVDVKAMRAGRSEKVTEAARAYTAAVRTARAQTSNAKTR
jgi:2-keto-3-deoxy-6-phosphogluconate aldolase